MKNKKKRKKYNKKRYIFLVASFILFFCIICYAIYEVFNLLTDPTNIVTVENGKIYSECPAEGYIIRDEVVLKGENYKNGISQIKLEGEKVAKGENIFRYYTKDEEDLAASIQDLDNQIAETQASENSIFSSDLRTLESEIENKINEMYKENNINKIQECKSDIDELVKKKTKIIGELSPSGSRLKKLIQKRSEYENKLNSGSEYMKSATSGMVSYKVDGLEEVLSVNSLENINKEFLDNLKLKTGEVIANNNECGKIINNYYCYIATVLPENKMNNLKEGDNIKIRLLTGEEISASIEKINKDSGENYVVFLKITKSVEELIEYRKINFDIIYWSYSGLKVPNSSIIEENNLNYVIRSRAGYQDKILVKVKKQNETYSIIEDYTTEELKELGWNSTEIVNKKSIGIYDEIIVNPEEIQ